MAFSVSKPVSDSEAPLSQREGSFVSRANDFFFFDGSAFFCEFPISWRAFYLTTSLLVVKTY